VFEEISGLPAHALLIHAAVVFIPLLAVAAVGYAVVPRLRPRIWWAVGLLALAGGVCAVVARQSGEAFRARLVQRHLASPQILDALRGHEHFGTMTMWFTLALAVVTLIGLWLMPPVARTRPDTASDADSAAPTGSDAGHGAASPGTVGPPTSGSTTTRLAAVPTAASTARPAVTGRRGGGGAAIALAVITVALALASLYYVYRTGDSGAHIVWNGY
jgi:lysozyme family protein